LTSLGEISPFLKHIISLSQFLLIILFRIRAQNLLLFLPTIIIQEGEGKMAPLIDEEVRNCAAIIAAAFVNPSKQN
jgi:hypothetical protein